MPVVDKMTDDDLRSIIYKYDHVIVKFVDAQCPICKELEPTYRKLAESPAYKDVRFLRMQASENPVSSRQVRLTGTPFIATYYKGLLQACGLVKTAGELEEMLQDLVLLPLT
ncbi:protein disulfide isomerase family protein [Pontibacter liquoris]|uniref:protein disulfide isomerase family protein n=1 Tax=Pontibacter liquoris TaxID=2905677 RepID=UPI001FA7387E|nr:protein disulfide isomerase family protein [Pontibacter liquoris]